MHLLPVIAIVGRPNVGKSTLFNRLTRTRDALVSDVPGLTRDRQYGVVNIGCHHFIMIDTGGITHEKNEINQLTTAETMQALLDADKILFLVDGRASVTPDDQKIADQLRKLNKTLIFVVNKTEGIAKELAIADFYQLGFGTPYAISSAHGEGMSELLDVLMADHLVPSYENKQPTEICAAVHEDDEPVCNIAKNERAKSTNDRMKLAIIGRPNVGKSTLTNRLLGEERVIVYDQPGTTRDSIFIPLERHDKQYTLIDTAGIRRRGKVFEAVEKFSIVKTLQAIEASHVVLFVIDAKEGVTEQDLRLIGFILESGKSIVIAINKWDKMTDEERHHVHKTIDRRLNFLSFVRIHFISALHGSGVGNLFDSIDEAYQSANKKFSTLQLTKILLEAINVHMPPLVQGRRIKLRYAHMGGHNPPIIVIHGNQVHALPEAYKRYLANTYQLRLKLMGTPIHIALKSGENPYRHRKNELTLKQRQKKKRLIQHNKKGK